MWVTCRQKWLEPACSVGGAGPPGLADAEPGAWVASTARDAVAVGDEAATVGVVCDGAMAVPLAGTAAQAVSSTTAASPKRIDIRDVPINSHGPRNGDDRGF